VIYDVDSTVYDPFKNDTVYYKYQLKELNESEFSDNEGRISVRIERYIRYYNAAQSYDSIPWVLKNVWYSTLTSNTAERVESNQRYVKLVFPVLRLISWNGNAQNALGNQLYQYQMVNQPAGLGILHFDSTLVVIQRDETDLLNRRYYMESYAKNVGMISKKVLDVYDTKIDTIPVVNRIKGGVYMNMSIHSFGKQ
jgi:hypothetical protein